MNRFHGVLTAAGLIVAMATGVDAAARPATRPGAGATRPAAEDPILMLRKKVQEATALADEQQKAGKDVNAAQRLIASARTLISENKLREANQALDRALEILKPQK